MTDRALKKGWYPGLIRSVCDKKNEPALLPIIFQGLSLVPSGKHADKEWFPAHAAPDRCFKPEPEPAEPDALEVGERVYVDDPTRDVRGWGTISCFYGERQVNLISPNGPDEGILLAACHRAGPQSEPPASAAVFLGRYHFPLSDTRLDLWWADGVVQALDDVVFTPKEIEGMVDVDFAPTTWQAALAVARALDLVEAEQVEVPTCWHGGPTDHERGLVEAEKEPAPEPERPRSKFQKGQVLEFGRAKHLHVRRIVGEPEWTTNDGLKQWVYPAESLDGQRSRCGEVNASDPDYSLRPHTMTIADAPDAVLVAILRNKPVRVVGAPVNHEGLPYSEKLGSMEVDWLLRGGRVAITEVVAITNAEGHSLAVLDDARSLWPWNLEVAPGA